MNGSKVLHYHETLIKPTSFSFIQKPTKNMIFRLLMKENRQITKAQNVKVHGIIIDSNLSRKQHINDIISELNKGCLAIRSVKPFISLEVMRLIYFSYFHSVLFYKIILWGNSVHSKYIFKIQKRTVRIITSAGIRDSCRDLFKKIADPAFLFSVHILLTHVCS